jgi:hypothetical protein
VHKNKDVVGKVTCIKDKNGRLITEEKINIVWKDYLEELLNEDFYWTKKNLQLVSEGVGDCEEITFEEVKVAIEEVEAGKAPGSSGDYTRGLF